MADEPAPQEFGTFACGAETPAGANPYAYALDEDSGLMGTASASHLPLNRYAFTWLGPFSAQVEGFRLLLDTLVASIGEPAIGMDVWATHPQSEGRPRELVEARCREFAAEHRAAGREVYEGQSLGVAVSPFQPGAVLFDLERLRRRGLRRSLLLIGSAPAVDELLTQPLRATMQRYGHSGILGPGPRFERWLADRGLSVLYPADDACDRTLMVMLGVHAAPIDLLDERGLISRLYTGGDAYRAWHLSPRRGPDVNRRGVEIRSEVTDEIVLVVEGKTLRGARLEGAYLHHADLNAADLRGADLRNADLRSAHLRRADLRQADLTGADLMNVRVEGSTAAQADMREANLSCVDFSRADLRGASLQAAFLYGITLEDAQLQGADLRGTGLGEAGTRLQNARYDRTTLWPDSFDPAAFGAVLVD
jgi:hypothetical protein